MNFTDHHFKNIYIIRLACMILAGIIIIGVIGSSISYFISNIIEDKKDLLGVKQLKFDNLEFIDHLNVNVKNIIITGKNANNNEYKLTASEANKSSNGIIEMKNINLLYSFDKKDEKIQVSSESGIMRESEKLITFDQPTNMTFSDYSLKSNKISINLIDNTAKSNEEIIMTKGKSFIRADNFSVENKKQNKTLNLSGNVKASINLSNDN